MSIYYKSCGFVFKKEDQFEADRVFSVFSQDLGRIEVVGRAIRKIASKLRSGMDIFYFSEFEFVQGKNRKTLTDAVAKEKFNSIKKTPESFFIALKICEALDDFIKGEQSDNRVFILLNETFSELNNHRLSNSALQLLYLYFFWNLISFMGYGPELYCCAVCQSKLHPYSLYFSNEEGGIICHQCALKRIGSEKINSDTVKILRLMLKKEWEILQKVKMGNYSQNLIEKITKNYKQYLLNSYVS